MDKGFIKSLRKKISESSLILTSGDLGFAKSLERWSNLDLKTPLAVVQPSNESDILSTVSDEYLQLSLIPVIA